MSLKIITPPASEPVTLQEAKDHLRVDFEEDDSLIDGLLIPTARQSVEVYLRRALISQTQEYSIDNFSHQSCIKLPNPPLQSIESIKYLDIDDAEQLLDAAEYRVYPEDEPGVVTEQFESAWPETLLVKNAVKVRYIAGYADAASVPFPIKSAMLLLIGHLYENREENMVVSSIESLPFGFKALLQPYRIISF